ncbi:MAG: hypothetical protein CW691_04550 [Candidatus Bathyarchaeum sp.]|nr:MAG: hypothetical protein CW691_04550 [Candidatus Bathyarchaeum sp.]
MYSQDVYTENKINSVKKCLVFVFSMTVNYSLEDLLQILKEIKKAKQRTRFRKLLKIFLIGYGLGKNNEKHIQSLTINANKVLSIILERYFEETSRNSLYEKPEIYQEIKTIESVLKSSEDVFGNAAYNSSIKKIQILNNVMIEKSQKILQLKIEVITKQVNDILDSGSYLITPKQKEVLTTIESFEKEIKQLQKMPILNVNDIQEN